MTKEQKNEKLQDLYDVVYEFTGVMDDHALNILDDVLLEDDTMHIQDKWFDEVEELTDDEFERLSKSFIEAAARCEEEC